MSTDVDALVAFLRACLDDDERVAREADEGPWDVVDRPADHTEDDWEIVGKTTTTSRFDRTLQCRVEVHTRHEIAGHGYEGGGVWGQANAEHIARWDPARVLAEVDAKRQLLDLHAPFVDHHGRVRCSHCTELCHSRSGLGCDDPDAPYPCPTARLLALPYAGRPGYRAEWRP